MIFDKGSKVEVLSKKEVPSGAWRAAEILSGNGSTYTVRYDKYGGAGGETQTVSMDDIRPCPPRLDDLESLVPGDVVEVFDNFSWKMANVSKLLGKNEFLIRLLGCTLEIKVRKFNIRVRQTWQDYEWIKIEKGFRSHKDEKHVYNSASTHYPTIKSQVGNTKLKISLHVKDDKTAVHNKLNFCGSKLSSKRGFYLPLGTYVGATKKFRAGNENVQLERVFTADSYTVPKQVDTVAFSRKPMAQRHSCGDSFKSKDDDIDTSSVGSCSTSSNNYSKHCHHISSSPVSDAESFYLSGCGESNSVRPIKEELEDDIRRLELYAYRATMEAWYVSGPLSWEQEALMTNLRLSLNISNDEHLMHLRSLFSI